MATNPGPSGTKRKRDPMFAASEKMALIELVEKYFTIVENKKTDGVTMKRKIEQWQRLTLEFNAMSSIHPRDWTTLKNCWENLKKRAKQLNTLRNQHFMGTGGGPPKKPIEDPAIEKVLDLIKTRVDGYVNKYDSDGINILVTGSGAQDVDLDSVININESFDNNETLEQTIDIEVPATETQDWSQYTPHMLRGPINQALITSPTPSPDVQQEIETQEQSSRESSTPRPTASTSGNTSRRRPALKPTKETDNVAAQRVKTLIEANNQAREEHSIKMNILRLQEEREKELLAQEKIKTELEKTKLEIEKIKLEIKKREFNELT